MKKRSIFVLALSFVALLQFSPAMVKAEDQQAPANEEEVLDDEDEEEVPSIPPEVKSQLTRKDLKKIAAGEEVIVPRFTISLS